MVLNETSKREFRKYIEQELDKLDDIELQDRIKLEPELLEQLLFEKGIFVTSDNFKIAVKYPIWSGEFLSKIDLSQISFDDVCWNLGDLDINYSNTNAVINLDSQWDFCYCNFSGIDFSHTKIFASQIGTTIKNCNFKNTGLKIIVSKGKKLNSHFSIMLEKGYFNGCYLNDRLIDLNANKRHTEEILLEYNNMVSQYCDDIANAIQKAKK